MQLVSRESGNNKKQLLPRSAKEKRGAALVSSGTKDFYSVTQKRRKHEKDRVQCDFCSSPRTDEWREKARDKQKPHVISIINVTSALQHNARGGFCGVGWEAKMLSKKWKIKIQLVLLQLHHFDLCLREVVFFFLRLFPFVTKVMAGYQWHPLKSNQVCVSVKTWQVPYMLSLLYGSKQCSLFQLYLLQNVKT